MGKSAVSATFSLPWRSAIGRGAVYAFLARALAYPDATHRAALEAEILPVLGGLRPVDEAVATALVAAIQATEAPLEDLRRAYGELFPPVGSSDCAAYEAPYRTRDLFQETEILADVAGFYRAHGLAVGGREHERPDHIAVELEFMAVVARKEAHALAELGRGEVEICRSTQDAFLRDHLGGWGRAFGARLQRRATHPCYRATGELLDVWLASDMNARRIIPADPVGEPPPALTRDEIDADDSTAACPLEGVPS